MTADERQTIREAFVSVIDFFQAEHSLEGSEADYRGEGYEANAQLVVDEVCKALAILDAEAMPKAEVTKDARELAENIIPMPFVGRWSAQNYTSAITEAAAAIERFAQARAESAEARVKELEAAIKNGLEAGSCEGDASDKAIENYRNNFLVHRIADTIRFAVDKRTAKAEAESKELREALEAIAAKEQQKAIHYYQDSFGELMNVNKLEAGGFKMGSTERLLRHTLRDCGDIARAALAKAKGEKD